MEKSIRSQNLKFSVEFPDDNREGHGPTSYEIVKKRKVDSETADGGTDMDTNTDVKESRAIEKEEFEWDIETVNHDSVNQVKGNDSVKGNGSMKEETLTDTKSSVRKSNNQHKDTSHLHIESSNNRNIVNNKTLTERKTDVKTITELKPKPKESEVRANDVGERLYNKRKIWRSDQRRQGMLIIFKM